MNLENFSFIEVELICNIVLVSGIQQSDSTIYIYIHIFFLFQIISLKKIFNIFFYKFIYLFFWLRWVCFVGSSLPCAGFL